VIANPNAPTGVPLSLADLERLLRGHPDAVVLVDEAYVDFGTPSAVPLIPRHDNLLVVQTLSKSRSLAGLRVGFALGHPDLIQALERVKDSFNSYPLGRLAQAGAVAAIEDDAHFQRTCGAVMATRQRLVADLLRLGFEVLPSTANFVFARHPAHEGLALFRALRAKSIVVRHFAKPRIADFLRITVGTDAECKALVGALGELVG
jgi:histidinol-phosphate aminotransferase